jgi:hypothetical protein
MIRSRFIGVKVLCSIDTYICTTVQLAYDINLIS